MKEELDRKLVEDFPILYKDRRKSMTETAMCWGFECGDGWEPLIRELSKKIEEYNNTSYDLPTVAIQVKEKFGSLRFYINYGPRWIHDLLDEYEDKSEETCETCGRPGQLCERGTWVKTLCEDHRTMYEYLVCEEEKNGSQLQWKKNEH